MCKISFVHFTQKVLFVTSGLMSFTFVDLIHAGQHASDLISLACHMFMCDVEVAKSVGPRDESRIPNFLHMPGVEKLSKSIKITPQYEGFPNKEKAEGQDTILGGQNLLVN